MTTSPRGRNMIGRTQHPISALNMSSNSCGAPIGGYCKEQGKMVQPVTMCITVASMASGRNTKRTSKLRLSA